MEEEPIAGHEKGRSPWKNQLRYSGDGGWGEVLKPHPVD
jgi:hypothetical protein